MASVRDSAEVKLIGFEQGVNVKTNEQIFTQTRARFHPLANPSVVITDKADRKASSTLRIKDIPTDPGDGNYTLYIESHKGSSYDLKIRAVGDLSATSVITVNPSVTKAVFDVAYNADPANLLHNKTFLISDNTNNNSMSDTKYVTFTLDKSASRITRSSSTSWTIGISDVTNTNDAAVRAGIANKIFNAIKQARDDKDLKVTPILDSETVKLTQDQTGAIGNTTASGTAITSGYISIPSFSGGKNGLFRTLNTGNLNHPKDSTARALGLNDLPGYYPGENAAVPYTDIINSKTQRIKRLTFDLNKIINYNTATTGVSSRIVFDDTLFIVQETSTSSVESAVGKKIKQTGLDVSSNAITTGSFGLENWKMTSKKSGDFIFHDLVTDTGRWSSTSRDTTLSVNFPSLLEVSPDQVVDQLFMTIRYTLLNTIIPTSEVTDVDAANQTEILFKIVSGGDNALPYNIVYDAAKNRTEVFINPYKTSLASDSRAYRQRLFVDYLALALRDLSSNSSLHFTLNTISAESKSYTIKVSEKSTKLTFFEAFFEEDVLIDEENNSAFLSFAGNLEIWKRESNILLLDDGSKNTKKIEIRPDRSRYSPERDDRPFSVLLRQRARLSKYTVGIKGITSPLDFRNRIFDTLHLAKENSDIDITPSMQSAHARISVSDGDQLVAGGVPAAKNDRITIKSTKSVEKTYTIVRGGSSGRKAVRTGTILKAGSAYESGNTVSGGDSCIGTVAVNIKDSYTRRDVLNELMIAIQGETGHNSGKENSTIIVDGVDTSRNGAQYLHLKQVIPGAAGNNTVVLTNFTMLTVTGFTAADDDIAKTAIKLTTTANTGKPALRRHGRQDNSLFKLLHSNHIAQRNKYTLEDFSTSAINVEFRDGSDTELYYTRPNHDVEVLSFGFGKKASDLRFYEDLSLNGPKLDEPALGYPNTLDIDPVFFLTASPTVRFPIQVNNLGSILGFELDGVIEPLDIRTIMLGETITERPIRTLKGEMGGEYSFSSIRNEASIIHNKITFEETNNVAFFDNCPMLSGLMTRQGDAQWSFRDPSRNAGFNNVFYSRIPGIIFKNDARIQPYIDIEERVFQSNPLNGNNPETNEFDLLVSQVQGLNHIDDKNLGGENFRRRAGFDFSSSPHPGTDSIVFGGLRYV